MTSEPIDDFDFGAFVAGLAAHHTALLAYFDSVSRDDVVAAEAIVAANADEPGFLETMTECAAFVHSRSLVIADLSPAYAHRLSLLAFMIDVDLQNLEADGR